MYYREISSFSDISRCKSAVGEVTAQTRLSFAHCDVCWPSAGVVALACVLAERQICVGNNLKNSKYGLKKNIVV